MVRLFDSDSENIISQFMLQNPNHPSPFAELSRKIPFTNKQISHHWNDKLNPLLWSGPLSDDERKFIHNWAKNNRKNNIYNWKHCQKEMYTVFNKLHSTNKIKNAWNSEQKRSGRTNASLPLSINDDTITLLPPSPIEPYFRPDLTKFDKTYLLNITYGYKKYHYY
ncbi:hypothetical protein RclHR1_01040015 [Rhizophagus clarus]|uniref:HTH myb-type domain-containing protein n=1 Tax=Rhizophagus clarus TaxID=94130 RepID=A0A2Z6Q1G3_9GLOM|nr:hypothetical protein RclHR1_01040015 [Rhizophagus clarus]GES77895.1 hypothetical protein GLOIN_2v1662134 [Rhizophagus clarus]